MVKLAPRTIKMRRMWEIITIWGRSGRFRTLHPRLWPKGMKY